VVATAGAGNNGKGGTNNGGNSTGCGAACDQSHNPVDYTKPCNPVPGNGCHQLPDTPCERGHGGTEIGNTLTGVDQLCDTGQFAFEAPGEFSNPQPLVAGGTDVYYCQIDAIAGAGISGDSIPGTATSGNGPYPLTNSVTITATPDGGGTPVVLTDSVTANFN
jgi:hypothetical protein